MFNKEETDRAPAISTGLADSLSGLLRQAVEDAQAIERTPGYRLQMSRWHYPVGGLCEVCMGGAVMARRLGADKRSYLTLSNYRGEVADKLSAIDYLRVGSTDFAAQALGTYHSLSVDQMEALLEYERLIRPELGSGGLCPWGVYLEGADILEAAGL